MKKYHFIGICGSSMSSLAVYLKNKGNYVQGSDLSYGEIFNKLQKLNIKVFLGHKKTNVGDVDVVVYNFAIKPNNEEFIEAKKRKIKLISRAELLGEIAKDFKFVISVAGSHGKTTTASMIYNCLKYANLKASLHIGGILRNEDFGFVYNGNDYFITEACEYKDSFLKLKSDIGIVLNIEPEHLDYFKTFNREIESFNKFARNSNKVISINNGYIPKKNVLTYGDKESIIYAKNIKIINNKYNYDCYFKNEFFMHVSLNALGMFNVLNSLSVILVCIILNIPKEYIFKGLDSYVGVKRRYEIISNNKYYIVHDYAHHPTEIKNVIRTFKQQVVNKKILVVFQPHTYSRTINLYNDFLKSFNLCDKLFLMKTFSAREKYNKKGSAYNLYKNIHKINKSYFANEDVGIKKITKELKSGYAVLLLGAGDIDKLAYKLKKYLES